MLADVVRALLGGLAAGVLPGWFWARFVIATDGLAERLAYSTAVSLACVPPVVLVLGRLLGTGITLGVAVGAVAIVAGSGALACVLRGAATGPGTPVLPRPDGIRSPWVLLLALAALVLALVQVTGLAQRLLPAPGVSAPGIAPPSLMAPRWPLLLMIALLVAAGLLGYRSAEASPGTDDSPRRGVRALAFGAVLALTGLLAYSGPVRGDWPYGRGMDMFSHAVMTEQMLAHGTYGSYLVYPPGFSALSAVICRLAGLSPLALFPVLGPALLLLTTLAGYALATRLWGWRYGLAAAAVSGLVLVGPFQAFSGGLYPDLIDAFFLIVMFVAALVTFCQAPSARSGLLVAVVGPAIVLYHSVGTLYLVLLLAAVAVVCLPYLLLRGRPGRVLAGKLTLALAALSVLSVAYAWSVYDLAGFFGGRSSTRATVALDVGSQPVLPAGDLLAWVGSPVIWLGLLGIAALVAAAWRMRSPEQVAAAIIVVTWCAVMYLGSRTVIDGFPQRFERDVGAPLAVIAALGVGMIATSLTRLGSRWLGAAATCCVAVFGAVQFGHNLAADGLPTREVLTPAEAAAGAWLRQHNTGGSIISTPDLRRGVTNRAVLAMGGYSGLQSYPLQKILHPRSLPTAGRGPLLDSRYVLFEPATCRAAQIIVRDEVRYVFLYRPGREADIAGFRDHPRAYRQVFENSQIVIYAPVRAWLRTCAGAGTALVPAARTGSLATAARSGGRRTGLLWLGRSGCYGAATSLIRVPQFASAVRVLPQRKLERRYSLSVQLWPMYSEAIQTLLPTGTAAP